MMRRAVFSDLFTLGSTLREGVAWQRMMVFALLSLTVLLDTRAALPPKYLEVKDFQMCLKEKDMGTYHAWCLPTTRPAACPKESWRQLRRLSGPDKVPAC